MPAEVTFHWTKETIAGMKRAGAEGFEPAEERICFAGMPVNQSTLLMKGGSPPTKKHYWRSLKALSKLSYENKDIALRRNGPYIFDLDGEELPDVEEDVNEEAPHWFDDNDDDDIVNQLSDSDDDCYPNEPEMKRIRHKAKTCCGHLREDGKGVCFTEKRLPCRYSRELNSPIYLYRAVSKNINKGLIFFLKKKESRRMACLCTT